jgi:hypothetical protein
MSSDKKEEIARLLDLSLEEVYFEIGKEVLKSSKEKYAADTVGGTIGAGKGSTLFDLSSTLTKTFSHKEGLERKKKINVGQEWVAKNWDKLRITVCYNDKIKKLRESQDHVDSKELVEIIAEIIVNIIVGGVPPYKASVAIVKTGLNHFCSGIW